jgi:PPM family protein phosphatase
MTQRLSVTALTHRGARRSGNEDAIGVGNWAAFSDMAAPVHRLVDTRTAVACAVADGMGGHQGGSVASRFIISRLGREARELNDAAGITGFLQRVDADLIRLGAEQGFTSPPGSTIAAVVFRPMAGALVFNVGDSRIYRLRDRTIVRLSTDDTLEGEDPSSEADIDDGRTGRRGHMLTQAIGGKRAPERITPHILEDRPAKNDAYFLCTDGVTDVIGTSDLTALVVKHAGDDTALVSGVFDLAMERGGPDNISICIARPEG